MLWDIKGFERNKKQPSLVGSWERQAPWVSLHVLGYTGFGSQACVEGTCTVRAGPDWATWVAGE